MEETYKTTDLDMGTIIKHVTGVDPIISYDTQRIATLTFPCNQAVTDVVMRFESGITIDAKTLLTIRRQLYRRVKSARI